MRKRIVAPGAEAGFTLIELMLGSVVATVVAGAVFAVYFVVFRDFKRVEAATDMAFDSQLLADYITTEIQNVGGAAVVAGAGTFVEDNCQSRDGLPNCEGSDRLTLTEAIMPVRECGVAGIGGGVVAMATTPGSPCCLDASWLNTPVMLTKGNIFVQRWVSTVNTVQCNLTLSAGQAQLGDNNPPPVLLDWSGGTATRVQVRTYYVDRQARELRLFQDQNGNGRAEAAEVKTLAVDTQDLQVALAYDCGPEDGLINENGDANDELLFNAPAAVEAIGQGALACATRDLLHSIHVGFLLGGPLSGSPTGTPAGAQRLLNGPERVSQEQFLKGRLVRAVPRNRFQL